MVLAQLSDFFVKGQNMEMNLIRKMFGKAMIVSRIPEWAGIFDFLILGVLTLFSGNC